ncbi:unnamed protein product, partial [Adineta steineri]
KNSYHHRVIQHSPYSVLFGHEPKIGLTSTFLPSSIFSNLKTEEELLDHLGSSAVTSDANEQRESEHEIDKEDSKDEEHQMSNEADDTDGSNDLEEKMALRNNRQKRQADEFL